MSSILGNIAKKFKNVCERNVEYFVKNKKNYEKKSE